MVSLGGHDQVLNAGGQLKLVDDSRLLDEILEVVHVEAPADLVVDVQNVHVGLTFQEPFVDEV